MAASTTIRVLIVEDDVRLARGLAMNLALEEFDVQTVHSGEAALDALAVGDPPTDFVVLDIMLPGIDGLEVCRQLRDRGDRVPILFLTARGSDADKVLGLRTGGDDYLTKPFVVEELMVRIRGILRRTEWSKSPAAVDPQISIGPYDANLTTMRAQTSQGERDLTEREVILLRFFAENDGRVLQRGELLEHVWGYAFDTSTRTLDTFVHRLRKYFEADPRHPQHFHTVRGVGYRFTSLPEGRSIP